MIVIRNNFILVILSLFISGCITNQQNNHLVRDKIDRSRDNWIYYDLMNKIEIKTLVYSKKHRHSVQLFPNFIIGMTSNGKIITVIDKDLDKPLKKGETIKVIPQEWTKFEKEVIVPSFTVFRTKKENDLLCNVDTVFYGKIVEKGDTPQK